MFCWRCMLGWFNGLYEFKLMISIFAVSLMELVNGSSTYYYYGGCLPGDSGPFCDGDLFRVVY